jgi:hypothetical protein
MSKQATLFSDSMKAGIIRSKDDGIKLEDSIFAKPKSKKKVANNKQKLDASKILDMKDLYLIYVGKYVTSQKLFKFSVIEPELLNVSLENINVTFKSMYNDIVVYLVKMIKCVAKSSIEVIHAYMNCQTVMIEYINDVYPNLKVSDIFKIIDISYKNAFDELCV